MLIHPNILRGYMTLFLFQTDQQDINISTRSDGKCRAKSRSITHLTLPPLLLLPLPPPPRPLRPLLVVVVVVLLLLLLLLIIIIVVVVVIIIIPFSPPPPFSFSIGTRFLGIKKFEVLENQEIQDGGPTWLPFRNDDVIRKLCESSSSF